MSRRNTNTNNNDGHSRDNSKQPEFVQHDAHMKDLHDEQADSTWKLQHPEFDHIDIDVGDIQPREPIDLELDELTEAIELEKQSQLEHVAEIQSVMDDATESNEEKALEHERQVQRYLQEEAIESSHVIESGSSHRVEPKVEFDHIAFIQACGSKSAAIRALYAADEGNTISMIANALRVKYQHVRNVLMQPIGGKLPSRGQVKASITNLIEPTTKDVNVDVEASKADVSRAA